PDGKLLAAGSALQFWELPEGTERRYGVPAGGVVAFSPDGRNLLTGRHWLVLCDVPTCTIRHVLPRPGTLFVPAALSADRSVLPVDSTPRAYHWKLGNEITFWDFTKQTCVRKNAVKGGVTLTPSPDGRWLASGEYGKISLYDATTQERVDTWND